MTTQRRRFWIWLTFLVLMPFTTEARADDEDDDEDDSAVGSQKLTTHLSGFLSSDVRYGIPKVNPFYCKTGGYCLGKRSMEDLKSGFVRNENIARMRFTARAGDYKGVAEIDFVWTGFSQGFADLRNLAEREQVDPFRLEAHAIYLDIADFITKGMDLRVGKQIVTWGRADMFNPTSNLNALDLEDVLLFGDRVSNNMIRLDYNFWKEMFASLVWVPIFKPNQLPASATLAVKGVDRIPMADAGLRRRLHVEREGGELLAGPTRVVEAIPVMPEHRIESSQVGLRLGGKVAKMDYSFSYYYGRSGIPQPYVQRTYNVPGFIDAKTALMYPRMQVAGFDFAGQIPLGKLGGGNRGIGVWFELAVVFPQRVRMSIHANDMPVVGSGEYDYDGDGAPGGTPPTIVSSRPFAKWVLGFDYTFNKYVFMNVQWVHGFPDEFGFGDWLKKSYVPTRAFVDLDTTGNGQDDLNLLFDCGVITGVGDGRLCAKEYLRPRQGDYLVAGVDLKFFSEKFLLRLFLILDMTGTTIEEFVAAPGQDDPTVGRRRRSYKHAFTGDGFSLMVYPQLTYSAGAGVELALGGLFGFGKPHTKFGDPATGGSLVFMKGKFNF